MNSFINELCLKRLCLSCDTDFVQLNSGLLKSNINECGNSHHIACIVKYKGCVLNRLSYGINTYNIKHNNGTTHAEVNAINNLPSCPNNHKHLKKINIFVIRTSNTGKIGMSKPCINCINNMSILPQKKGYIIKNVSYSDSTGKIITTSLNNLRSSEDFHVSKYYKTYSYLRIER